MINSLSASAGMGIMAEKMIENRKNGLSIHENKADIENEQKRISALAMIGDLVMLKRGGRISASAALFGGILQIKPILTLVKENGTLSVINKIKGVSASLKYMLNIYLTNRNKESDILYIVHTNEENNANKLESMIKEAVPAVEIRKRLLSPIIGAHLGPGTVAIFFFDNSDQHNK